MFRALPAQRLYCPHPINPVGSNLVPERGLRGRVERGKGEHPMARFSLGTLIVIAGLTTATAVFAQGGGG
ncbi:MAG: hypothetical protein ACK495_03585, partial [Bradyrhizobium sp.]